MLLITQKKNYTDILFCLRRIISPSFVPIKVTRFFPTLVIIPVKVFEQYRCNQDLSISQCVIVLYSRLRSSRNLLPKHAFHIQGSTTDFRHLLVINFPSLFSNILIRKRYFSSVGIKLLFLSSNNTTALIAKPILLFIFLAMVTMGLTSYVL